MEKRYETRSGDLFVRVTCLCRSHLILQEIILTISIINSYPCFVKSVGVSY